MSGAVTGAGAGASAAMAAAAAERRRRLEEQEMTKYSDQELAEGWEFKIVRSPTGAFRKPEVFQELCEEEARAGWVMVEKFDNSRVRFKRPVAARRNDRHLEFDAYRTQYANYPRWLGLWIILGMLAFVLIFIAIEYAGR